VSFHKCFNSKGSESGAGQTPNTSASGHGELITSSETGRGLAMALPVNLNDVGTATPQIQVDTGAVIQVQLSSQVALNLRTKIF